MSDEDTHTPNPKGGTMPQQSFLDRITQADLEEAGDLYLEARATLPRESAEWRAIVEVFHARLAAQPVKPAEPLVSFRPSGR